MLVNALVKPLASKWWRTLASNLPQCYFHLTPCCSWHTRFLLVGVHLGADSHEPAELLVRHEELEEVLEEGVNVFQKLQLCGVTRNSICRTYARSGSAHWYKARLGRILAVHDFVEPVSIFQ